MGALVRLRVLILRDSHRLVYQVIENLLTEWEEKQRSDEEKETLRKEIDQAEERLKIELKKVSDDLVRLILCFLYCHPADASIRVGLSV